MFKNLVSKKTSRAVLRKSGRQRRDTATGGSMLLRLATEKQQSFMTMLPRKRTITVRNFRSDTRN